MLADIESGLREKKETNAAKHIGESLVLFVIFDTIDTLHNEERKTNENKKSVGGYSCVLEVF